MSEQELNDLLNDENKSFEEKEIALSREFEEASSGLSLLI